MIATARDRKTSQQTSGVMTTEDQLRAWPRDRIKPQAVARGLDTLLADLDALRAELAAERARAEAAEQREALLQRDLARERSEGQEIAKALIECQISGPNAVQAERIRNVITSLRTIPSEPILDRTSLTLSISVLEMVCGDLEAIAASGGAAPAERAGGA